MNDSRSERIVLVDDDAGVRNYLRAALAATGHDLVEAVDAAAALTALNAGSVAVMLIDGILPDRHGLDLAADVLDRPDGSLVAMSFVTGAVRDPIPLAAGIGVLGKPLRPRDLLSGVADLLMWRAAGGSPIEERRAVLASLSQRFLVGR